MFNNCWSVNALLYSYVLLGLSHYYLWWMVGVLFVFLIYRVPYCYSPFCFVAFLIIVVFGLFLSLFFWRLSDSINAFFGSLVPVGTPLYICPLVCIAESISYIIRPIVLILRPFINISLGCYGAIALCNLCCTNWLWGFVLFILFFYEVFVAVVHWYIVTSILLFSVNH